MASFKKKNSTLLDVRTKQGPWHPQAQVITGSAISSTKKTKKTGKKNLGTIAPPTNNY